VILLTAPGSRETYLVTDPCPATDIAEHPRALGAKAQCMAVFRFAAPTSLIISLLVIVQGRPNGMPSYGGQLTDTQVWKLVALVTSLGAGWVQRSDRRRELRRGEERPERITGTRVAGRAGERK
jgi:hypothetical protein